MRGFTLLETLAVLVLFGVAASLAWPVVGGYRERAAVLTARETLAALLMDTRTAALRTGAATLRLDGTSGRASVVVGDSVHHQADVTLEGTVIVRLPGGRTSTEIAFGGLGLGVFANETVELVAGRARARLVVSSYGRVRRE